MIMSITEASRGLMHSPHHDTRPPRRAVRPIIMRLARAARTLARQTTRTSDDLATSQALRPAFDRL